MSDGECNCECEEEKSGSESMSADEFDMVFDVVADRNRRVMLHLLKEDEEQSLDEIVDGMEPHVEADPPRIVTSLHQKHLPRLDDTGILDYDSRSEAVQYYGHPFLEDLLDCTKSGDLFEE